MIKFMETPQHLNELSQDLWLNIQEPLTAIHRALETQGVYALFPEGTTKENLLFANYQKLLAEGGSTEFSIAAASAQSGGKSTLFNAVLTYPLLATAANTTTACATEIRYGSRPSVQIRYYGEYGQTFEDGPVLRGEDRLSETLWRELLEFACLCVKEKVILPETLQYYAEKRLSKEPPQWNELRMSRDDPKQVIQLLLILLTVYVGQNDEKPQENRMRVCAERNRLLQEIGVDPKRDYSVQVRWDSPLLERGLVLIDLPGLGANAKEIEEGDGRVRRSHDRITIDYLQNADAVFLFFDPSAIAGTIPLVLGTLLSGERMKYVVTKESRIIPIINKADLGEAQIPFTTSQVRSILKDLEVPVIYPMSAISGEYRLVKSGLHPIEKTWAYWEGRDNYRQAFQKFNHRPPTEDELREGILGDLKEAYYHPYAFDDLEGLSYELNLDQWLNMMTSDYINIMYTLKGIELLRMGLSANRVMVAKITGHIAMLRMLQAGGADLTQDLIKALEDAVKTCLQELTAEIRDMQNKMTQAIMKQVEDKGSAIRGSYQSAFQTIEKDIANVIRSRANQMRANFAGNYIIDPDETFTDSGRQAAQNNRSAYNGMLSDVKNFSVVSRLKSSEEKLTDMLKTVQRTYDGAMPDLIELYNEISQRAARAMDSSYETTMRAAPDSAQFDRIYGGLYRQLRGSILSQIDQFAKAGISVLTADTRVVSRQNDAINAASKLSLDHQNRYREASESYVKTLQTSAFIADHAFNMSRLKQTLELPFFSGDKQTEWSADAVELFTGQYQIDIIDILDKIRADMRAFNRAGLEGSVNGMGAFIQQKIGQGNLNINTEISGLCYYMQELILENTKKLMGHIESKIGTLREYAWAAQDVEGVQDVYRELETAVADGMNI